MDYRRALQQALDYIDDNVTNEMSAAEIAEKAGYSVYHFSRIFTETIGISVMSYVTWRKLQYALYDLSRGKRVIDVAMAGLQRRLSIGLGSHPLCAGCVYRSIRQRGQMSIYSFINF